MVTFRPARTTDPAAVALLEQYFDARAEGFPAEQGPYRRPVPVEEDFVEPSGVLLIVEGENLAGEPADVGCGGIRSVPDGPLGPRRELKHLWVQPHTRRLGYGRALVDELERRARAVGAAELVLDTHTTQAAAGALYERLGFVSIPAYNDNPNATVWLGKPLR